MEKIDVWPLMTAEMQAAIRKGEELQAALPSAIRSASRPAEMRRAYAEVNRYWNKAPPPVAKVEDLVGDWGGGAVKLRLYHPQPEEERPLLIYLHGGGYVVGDLDTHDGIMRRLCLASGWAVLGLDYSLAPEARFPRQIDEVVGAIERLDGVLAGRRCRWDLLALGGDSAGAHLSVSCCLELRARGLPQPAGLLLFYGGFGLEGSRSQALYGSDLDGLSESQRAFYRDAYTRSSQRDDPRYAVLKADLAGLPPSYLLTLTLDPLDDDSVALDRALRKAGVPTLLRREDGLLHGYLKYAPEMAAARRVLEEAGAGLAALAEGRMTAWMEEVAQAPGDKRS
ncbi:MAG: alpha/beta hydrolase [Rhodospirillales bacterium]